MFRCDISEKFTAHSTRYSTVTSTALKKGINLKVIKRTANWSESSLVLFAKHYNKTIVQIKDSFVKTSIYNLA